jgi:hypothetical protein
MWRQKIKKLRDNPFVVVSYLKNRIWYRFIADRYSDSYKDKVRFISGTETIKALVSKDTSLIRIGDGTFGYLMGSSIYFNNWQFRYNRNFAKKLHHALKHGQNGNILFCVPHTLTNKSKAEFIKEGIANEWLIWTAAKVLLKEYLIPSHTYGDATCFHPRYNQNIDFKALKDYLDTKHVIIVTSNIERFTNLKLGLSTTLIPAPSSDAWKVYEQLETNVIETIKKLQLTQSNTLVMISAAEAAKVMIYNLSNKGYTAWDTGQFFDLAAKEFDLLSKD